MAYETQVQAHLRTLTLLSLLSRVLIAILVVSSSYFLTPFDSSSRLVVTDTTWTWISSLLRWDAFHFAHIAQQGYAYEHSWAFFPALPLLMRASGHVLTRAGLTQPDMTAPLIGGALLAALLDPTQTLYRLSLHHLRSPSAAFLATALSLLPSSPATLRFAPYNEPFFTYCSYRGMWACARRRWGAASLWFALASTFRSNGILLAGFVGWGMLVAPYIDGKKDLITLRRAAHCVALVALPFVPFIWHNYTGYVQFCTGTGGERPEWCDRAVPSIYGHVQRAYWNVGFLRYWTLSNVPNFVLAMPVLASVYTFCVVYLGRVGPSLVGRLTRGWRDGEAGGASLFLAPSLLPHVLHALVLALLLTFNAHVQIALRVLPSVPLVHWAAASLLIERPVWGRVWLVWSVLWGAASCVLWAVFLPPA